MDLVSDRLLHQRSATVEGVFSEDFGVFSTNGNWGINLLCRIMQEDRHCDLRIDLEFLFGINNEFEDGLK